MNIISKLLADILSAKKTYLIVSIVSIILLNTLEIFAQPITIDATQLKIIASDAQPFDFFGSSISYFGNTVMVGAIGKDNYKGAVYVFEFDGLHWTEKQIITDPNATAGEFFGNAIDIYGYTAAIAGYGRDVVLIFNYIEGYWVYKHTISKQPSTGYFGSSLSLKGDKLIIGEEGTGSSTYGLAHIYNYNQNNLHWELVKTFFGNRKFGHSAAVSGYDTYLIGDYFSPTGSASGIVAYVKWNGVNWDSTLFAPLDSSASDNFGYSISTSDNKIFIGAPGCDLSFSDLGAVYFFTNDGSGLTQIEKISPYTMIGPSLRFGSTVSCGNKRIVIGCDGINADVPVYVFDSTASGYDFKYLVLPEFASTSNRFGESIDVSPNNYFVVGAPGEDTQRGAAYFFTPNFIGNAFNLDFYGGIFSSGTVSIDTITYNVSELPPGYESEYTFSWSLNSGGSLVFDGGYVGSDVSSILKKNTSRLCWLKRDNSSSPWEYIGGQLDGNYLKSTIPFNSSCQLVIVDSVGGSGVSEDNIQILNYELFQNYPNPFNPSTVISYQLPVSSDVTLKVYDILGNEIAKLVDEFRSAGRYEVEFNASTLPSGVYFYQLLVSSLQSKDVKAGEYVNTKKMILLK